MELIYLSPKQARGVALELQALVDSGLLDDDRVVIGQGREPRVIVQAAYAREGDRRVLDLAQPVEFV